MKRTFSRKELETSVLKFRLKFEYNTLLLFDINTFSGTLTNRPNSKVQTEASSGIYMCKFSTIPIFSSTLFDNPVDHHDLPALYHALSPLLDHQSSFDRALRVLNAIQSHPFSIPTSCSTLRVYLLTSIAR